MFQTELVLMRICFGTMINFTEHISTNKVAKKVVRFNYLSSGSGAQPILRKFGSSELVSGAVDCLGFGSNVNPKLSSLSP